MILRLSRIDCFCVRVPLVSCVSSRFNVYLIYFFRKSNEEGFNLGLNCLQLQSITCTYSPLQLHVVGKMMLFRYCHGLQRSWSFIIIIIISLVIMQNSIILSDCVIAGKCNNICLDKVFHWLHEHAVT